MPDAGGTPLVAVVRDLITFYPVFALVSATRRRIHIDGVHEVLASAGRFLDEGLRGGWFSLEEQVMAHFALEQVSRVTGRWLSTSSAELSCSKRAGVPTTVCEYAICR